MVSHAHPNHDNAPEGSLYLADESATLAAGEQLANALPGRLTVFLCGDLGAGKTTLTRGLLRGLGFTGKVKSPTYTLVEPYKDSRIVVYHFDFYRFTHAEEFLEAGLEEYFEGDGIRIVEWPDRAQPYLPAADLEILLQVSADGGRRLELRPLSGEGHTCLERFATSRTH
ncbi:tRNA (adenosine(37)-N6)-threonylcarbamoyltransferase complex ATPase subunit type 1 TsaE [Zoogloea sp.]|uniref:tRNA (adenosine(37)-N6)-threonylcarbamoyltransferase complex ATPase subunit type 1 TsaE n=1 Tax=Zoogloea sp. TaxID=49181 RepID=UPI0035ADB0BE